MYNLFRIIYTDLMYNKSRFDAMLLIGFYIWLVDEKPAIGDIADDRGRAAMLLSYMLTVDLDDVYWTNPNIDTIEEATGWVSMVGDEYSVMCTC